MFKNRINKTTSWIPSFAGRAGMIGTRHESQSGNAIVFILLGIVLFGALAATFMRGSQTGQGNLTKQQARMVAADLIAHGKALERGIDKMRRKGCAESQISVKGGYFSSSSEAQSPSDYSCHLFRPEGGGATPLTASELPPKKTGADSTFEYRITSTNQVQNTPTTASDLVVHISVNDDICKSINALLGLGEVVTVETSGGFASNPFDGTFYASPPAAIDPANGIAGCVKVTTINSSTSLDQNHFFYVLLAR